MGNPLSYPCSDHTTAIKFRKEWNWDHSKELLMQETQFLIYDGKRDQILIHEEDGLNFLPGVYES